MPLRTSALRRSAVLPLLAAVTTLAALAAIPATVSAQTGGPESLGFKKRFFVDIVNPSPFALENQALVLDVAAIRASVAPDFNTYFYALFEEKGAELALVVTQADDLDKDRYHDEIVVVRTLPANSTTRLACWYTPERSFQLFPADKAFARGPWAGSDAAAGWESNLTAFKLTRGRVGLYGKLQPDLILKKFPALEAKPGDWGMDLLGAGDGPGLGGLSLWDGETRLPLFGPGAPAPKLTVLATGRVRALVKAEYPPLATSEGEVGLTVLYSTFADAPYSRQDILLTSKVTGAIAVGPALEQLAGGVWTVDKAKGFAAVWGRGAGKAGEIGLAAFAPAASIADIAETAADRALRLDGRAGRRLTYWVAGAWERGTVTPPTPGAKGWAARAGELAARLLTPVKVEFKSK